MPDLLDYNVNRAGSKTLTIPTWDIVGRVVDSKDQSIVIKDITAAAMSFPQVLGQLTAVQQDAWVQQVVLNLIFTRFNI